MNSISEISEAMLWCRVSGTI